RRCVDLIKPDRVLLNTVTRPPAEDAAIAVPRDRLMELAGTFSPPGEILEDFHHPEPLQTSSASRADILELLARRPCTIDDIAAGLMMHRTETLKQIETLEAEGLIEARTRGTERLYQRRRS
ncbi:MAG TPA: radical SAM protein, partial [Planctomycetaceae bacterium]|nr:radical SAM protein [Planctomycetaceae bacterium]